MAFWQRRAHKQACHLRMQACVADSSCLHDCRPQRRRRPGSRCCWGWLRSARAWPQSPAWARLGSAGQAHYLSQDQLHLLLDRSGSAEARSAVLSIAAAQSGSPAAADIQSRRASPSPCLSLSAGLPARCVAATCSEICSA